MLSPRPQHPAPPPSPKLQPEKREQVDLSSKYWVELMLQQVQKNNNKRHAVKLLVIIGFKNVSF